MSITNRPPKQRGVSEISLHFFDDCYLETVIYGLIWNTLYLLKLYFPINLISIPALIFFNLFPLNYFGYALSLLRCDWTPFFRLCSIISYCKKLLRNILLCQCYCGVYIRLNKQIQLLYNKLSDNVEWHWFRPIVSSPDGIIDGWRHVRSSIVVFLF